MIIISFLGILSVFSEEIQIIKIEGSINEYNKIELVNNTKYSDFDCEIYLLEITDDNIKIKDTLGKIHLNKYGETSSCRMELKKNDYIWISGPQKYREFGYNISYNKKTIIITLKENTTIPQNTNTSIHIPYQEGYFKIQWMPYEYRFNN